MRKIILLVVLAALLAVSTASTVAAKSPIVRGEITDIGSDTITVLAKNGDSVLITLPEDFDLTLFVGDNIIAKGTFQEDGSLTAEWVRKIGKGSANEDAPEGGMTANAAFCNAGKKTDPHPLAVTIAEKYGVSTGWVMDYYCNGYSMGAILLALKTQELSGVGADELLAQRSGGQGWGKIWQEQHLIGSERDVNPPPGQLKKETTAGD